MKRADHLLIGFIHSFTETGHDDCHSIVIVLRQPFADRPQCDSCRFLCRISIYTGGNCGKSNGMNVMLLCQFQAVVIALAEQLFTFRIAFFIDRADRVNDVQRFQIISTGDLRFTRMAASEDPAFLQQLRAGSFVNSAVNAASSE